MPKEDDDKLTRPKIDADAFEREVTTDLDEETPDKPKGWALHTRILIGLAIGVIAGVSANYFLGGSDPRVLWVADNIANPIGQLFLRLLLMIVVPLVFSSMVVGVAGIGDVRKLGRVGLKTFGYCVVLSAISVVIGLVLANTIRPGTRVDPATAEALKLRYSTEATSKVDDANKASASAPKGLLAVVETIVPKNPINSLAGENPNMLHLMFFALVIGIAITLIPVSTTAPLLRGLEALYEVTAKIIEIIMKFAPYAVACLLFNNTARFGLDLLQALAWFVITVLAWTFAAHVRRVFAIGLFLIAPVAARVFPPHQDRHSHGIFNIIFHGNPADCLADI